MCNNLVASADCDKVQYHRSIWLLKKWWLCRLPTKMHNSVEGYKHLHVHSDRIHSEMIFITSYSSFQITWDTIIYENHYFCVGWCWCIYSQVQWSDCCYCVVDSIDCVYREPCANVAITDILSAASIYNVLELLISTIQIKVARYSSDKNQFWQIMFS